MVETKSSDYPVWLEYLRQKKEIDLKPGKTEFYLMQIAQEIRRVLSKNPASIKLDQFRLEVVPGKGDDNVVSKEEQRKKYYNLGMMAKSRLQGTLKKKGIEVRHGG